MRTKKNPSDVGAVCLTRPIRVLIADDRPVVREGIQSILMSRDGFECAVALGSDDADRQIQAFDPHILVMGSSLDGYEAGIVVDTFKEFHPGLRVVVLSDFESEHATVTTLRCGAVGLIGINSSADEICQCLEQVHAGRRQLAKKAFHALVGSLHFGGLDDRERQIIELMPRFDSNREIAAQLGVAESTVRKHIRFVLMKLNSRTRQEALEVAIECGVASARWSQRESGSQTSGADAATV